MSFILNRIISKLNNNMENKDLLSGRNCPFCNMRLLSFAEMIFRRNFALTKYERGYDYTL